MIYSITVNPALDRELTVPRLGLNEVLRAASVRLDCGGKGLNVSRALASLGQPSVAMGFIGGDTGRRLEQELHVAGVGTDFTRVAGETRTNVCIVGAEDGFQIKVNEPGPEVTQGEQAALLAKLEQRAKSGDWWVMSGSLPPGADPSLYAQIIDIVHAAGGRALLDASELALQNGCAARPYLVKPNAAEARWLTGIDVDCAETARAAAQGMHERGAQVVVISLGVEGALLSSDGAAWIARPPPVRVKNANGAGDVLLAGMLYSLSRAGQLPEALRLGVACGAAAASLGGTGVPTWAQVKELSRQVRISAVAA